MFAEQDSWILTGPGFSGSDCVQVLEVSCRGFSPDCSNRLSTFNDKFVRLSACKPDTIMLLWLVLKITIATRGDSTYSNDYEVNIVFCGDPVVLPRCCRGVTMVLPWCCRGDWRSRGVRWVTWTCFIIENGSFVLWDKFLADKQGVLRPLQKMSKNLWSAAINENISNENF